ncbi:MarR family transcriptional regulator [Rhodobacteraceae bacterium 2CG4]|uniref:MarR family transcriptional regulator n=1 Tax=Halovulum marinum TaxID=2662447 RepID=A0A6L5Z5H5_9RHOB|nr:MarR family transcriptional regulator [Halovulum marinum]MSU91294.1 MarR family transcriptional regulator [Halovulum marinum]
MAFLDDPERMQHRLAALAELERRLSFRISRLSKLLDSHAAKQLAPHELGLTWYRILMVLSIFGQTTAADLSRLMVIDRAQISRAVSDLLARGLLAQQTDPNNRRKKLLNLTPAGRAILSEVQPMLESRQKVFADLLDEDELMALRSAIDKISRHLALELEQPEAAPASMAAARD